MINLTEQSSYVIDEIERNGFTLLKVDNEWVYNKSSELQIQNIVDSYDPLPLARQQALERINRQTQEYMDSLTEDYPEFEKATWELQRQEAQAYNADNLALTPTIDTIALNRGVDRITLINKILTNTNNWSVLAASIAGQRQSLLDQVWTETDYKLIDQIKFEV